MPELKKELESEWMAEMAGLLAAAAKRKREDSFDELPVASGSKPKQLEQTPRKVAPKPKFKEPKPKTKFQEPKPKPVEPEVDEGTTTEEETDEEQTPVKKPPAKKTKQ